MECPHIPELSYDGFTERLLGRIGKKRVPISGSIALTHRCNLECVHCYVNQPAHDHDLRARELTSDQWCDILDQLANQGCLWLLVTGGEPLLHPGFRDIYAYAKRKGFLITLFTNGTLLTPEMVAFLEEQPPVLVDVTLYGITAETYEAVTDVAGSYRRCMRSIELLDQSSLTYSLKTIVMTLNHHEYLHIREYAQGLEVDFRHDAVVRPRLDGSRDTGKLRIEPSEVVDIDLLDAPSIEEWLAEFGDRLRVHETDHLYKCWAGIRSFSINPYGHLSLCTQAPVPSFSLLDGTFAEGWHDFLPTVRYQESTRDFACRHCHIDLLCSRCPAFAEWENGDPETRVDYVCEIAHLRAEAFGLRDLVDGERTDHFLSYDQIRR